MIQFNTLLFYYIELTKQTNKQIDKQNQHLYKNHLSSSLPNKQSNTLFFYKLSCQFLVYIISLALTHFFLNILNLQMITIQQHSATTIISTSHDKNILLQLNNRHHKTITQESNQQHQQIQPNHFINQQLLYTHNNNNKLSSPSLLINKKQHNNNNNTIKSPSFNNNNKRPISIKQYCYGENNILLKHRSKSQIKLINNNNNNNECNKQVDMMPIKIVKDKISHQQQQDIIKTKLVSSSHDIIPIKKQLLPNSNNPSSSSTKNHSLNNQLISSTSRSALLKTINNNNNSNENPQSILLQSSYNRNNHNNINYKHNAPQSNYLSTKNNKILTLTPIANQFRQRQRQYKPRLSIFERYNYQNYSNYNYKNPYKLHQQYSTHNRNNKSNKYKYPTQQKYQLHKGSLKNLQIIYCQTKYPQFVQKTNYLYQKANHNQQNNTCQQQLIKNSKRNNINIANTIDDSHYQSRRLLNAKNTTKWNYQTNNIKTESSKINCVHKQTKILFSQYSNSKSTLQKVLNQFKKLQKLTLLQQKQQQASTYNRYKTQSLTQNDNSKTVLLSLIVHKFPFLQNLTKSLRNHLFRIVFDQQSIDQQSKISIHGYLKFNRIFISKDASLEEISIFLIRFLFKKSPNPTFQLAENTLNQLHINNKKKLQSIMSFLYSIFNQIQICYETIITQFLSNPQIIMSFIQLIKNQ